MATLAEARRAWQQAVGIFEPLKRYRTAVLGDGVGTAEANLFVPNRDNYVFARDSTESSTFFEVLNLSAVQPAHNLPVIIGYPPNPGVEEEQILDVNYSGLGPNYVAADVPTTGQHHQQHEFQGGDQINVDPRQFLEGLVHPTDPISMKVVIESFMYFWDNWRKFTRTTSIDLTSYRPGSGNAVMVLITLDPETEQIRYHRGLDISTGSQEYQQGLLSVVPAPPGNEYPLGYVRLLSTNTTIDWGSTANDLGNARLFIQTPYLYFLDRLRQLEGYSGNDPNLSAMGVAGDTTDDPKHLLWSSVHADINSADVPANGDVITWDSPTNRWISAAASSVTPDHNHTAGANDGGKLTAAIVDSYTDFEEQSPAPGTPGANTARLYAKDKTGVSTLYYKQDDGTEVEITASGLGGAPTSATYWVESADATLSAEVVVGTTGITTAAYASRQAAATSGRLFFPNNSYMIERDTSSAWTSWGPLFQFTTPVSGDFAWINQGSASVDTTKGGILLSSPSNGNVDNFRIRKKAAPTVPYTIDIAFLHAPNPGSTNGGTQVAVGWRQSSDGKLVLLRMVFTGDLEVGKWTSPSVFSANYTTSPVWWGLYSIFWARIVDDNTNRITSVSVDGQNWQQFHSVGRTDFMTADEVLFTVNPANAKTDLVILSWKES